MRIVLYTAGRDAHSVRQGELRGLVRGVVRGVVRAWLGAWLRAKPCIIRAAYSLYRWPP